MLSQSCRHELQNAWLPHITDQGLDRIIDLLEQGSPLLIHGSFTRAIPQGCLATHLAWHHPRTANRTHDAGIVWLSQVVGLNPATSCVIREWDSCCKFDWQVRADLLEMLKACRQQRRHVDIAEAPAQLVEV